MKLISVGLDGASFDLLDPWLKEGELPNLRRLKKKGVWGDMESCLPPVSSPNWKCYSTGKNPGKLGIFWWENVDFERRRVYCPDYRTSSREIWDYLNQAGIRAAVINMPMMYPPRKIDGYITAGGPSAKEEGYAYPSNWEGELKGRGYRVHPSKSISNRDVCLELFEEVLQMMRQRFELARKLAEEGNVGFVHLTIFYINVLQHFLWDDNLVKKAWEVVDEGVGDLMTLAEGEGWALITFSDHGSNRIEEVFNVNAWLREEGLLRTRRALLPSLMRGIGITRERALRLSETLKLKRVLRRAVPEEIFNRVPTESGEVSREAKTDVVDWDRTSAVGSGQGPLYLAPGRNTREMQEKLIRKLEDLESPLTGRNPIRKVFKKEKVYSGKYLKKAPDLILDQAPNVHISGGIGKEEVFERPGKWVADNKRIGLFLAFGPDIRKEERIQDISILDIAPTILHSFGIPIPSDMDGKVVRNIFREGSDLAKKPVRHLKIKQEKMMLKRRIRSLRKAGKI